MQTHPLLLLCWLLASVNILIGQTITYQNNSFQLTPEPKLTRASNPKAKWGRYFWEFGDGHYKVTDKPRVTYAGYAKGGNKTVKVQLVPYYTVVEKPIAFSSKIQVRKGGRQTNYQMDRRSVYIETSANGEAVPGHDVRVALHYKAPAGQSLSEGYLIFFYNNADEKDELNIGFDPFQLNKKETSLHYGERNLGTNNPTISGNGFSTFVRLKNENDDYVVFKTSDMRPGESRRLFLTLQADERLRKRTGDKDSKLSFTALWVSASSRFDPSSNVVKYNMKLLQVHDPNNMKVRPRVAYYRKRRPQTFNYRINFQNEEKGIAQNAKISIALGKGLDKSSAKIKGVGAVNDELTWNFDCSAADLDDRARCFKEIRTSHPDSLLFYFHNIDLAGPTFFNKKISKGHVDFTISSDKKTPLTKCRAGISLNGTKPVWTDFATVKWRQKGLFVKSGTSFNLDAKDYRSVADKITDHLAVGLWYQNAPVGTGFSWGFALDYTPSRITRSSQVAVTTDLVPNGGLLTQSENIKLNLGEAQLHLGYQLGGILKFYATSGISIPVMSEFDLGAKVQRSLSDSPLLEDKVKGTFGLFGKEPDPALFNKTISVQSFVGYVGSIGVELGALNAFTVGVRNEYRFYNKFYYTNHDCYTMTNVQAYVRFKLFTL